MSENLEEIKKDTSKSKICNICSRVLTICNNHKYCRLRCIKDNDILYNCLMKAHIDPYYNDGIKNVKKNRKSLEEIIFQFKIQHVNSAYLSNKSL